MKKHPLKSRKFWIAVISAIILFFEKWLGLDLPTDSVLSIAALILGWLTSETLLDLKNSKP